MRSTVTSSTPRLAPPNAAVMISYWNLLVARSGDPAVAAELKRAGLDVDELERKSCKLIAAEVFLRRLLAEHCGVEPPAVEAEAEAAFDPAVIWGSTVLRDAEPRKVGRPKAAPAQAPPEKRRRKGTETTSPAARRSEQGPPLPEFAGLDVSQYSSERSVERTYHRTLGGQHGRRYVNGAGAQSMPTRFQEVALKSTMDFDMQNAMPAILLQIVNRIGLRDRDILQPELLALHRVATDRVAFCQEVFISLGVDCCA